MKKVLLWTFLGFLLFVPGVFVTFLYLQGVEEGSNPLLLLGGILLSGGGVFLLFKAGRIESSTPAFKDLDSSAPAGGETVLDRNNKMAAEWNKTSENSDKLKIVQAATVMQEENNAS